LSGSIWNSDSDRTCPKYYKRLEVESHSQDW
jgi:hypothetical protein